MAGINGPLGQAVFFVLNDGQTKYTYSMTLGKGYPFRKMRRIFSCWENPKPFCVLSLNIPSEKRLLLHFVPHYIQHRTLRFCQSFEKVFEKTSEKPIQNTPQNVPNPIDIHLVLLYNHCYIT